MPARSPTKRETWADVIPDVDRFAPVTIDELIDYARELRYPTLFVGGNAYPRHSDARAFDKRVTVHRLRHWQTIGIFPYPVKRWRDGATRALYPKEPAGMAIHKVLDLQDEGYSLDEIGPRLRDRLFKPWTLRWSDPFGWQQLASQLASQYTETTEHPPTHVQIVFVDAKGEKDTYSYPIETYSE